MSIEQMEYMLALEQEKKISYAARRCFISQPALSQQLAKIEKQEAALAEQAAQNQRKADAEKLATAFLESGKSLDEVLRALQ